MLAKPSARRAPIGERQWMVAVLSIGLLHGLIYVFLVPPWQHYEEPSHFEYSWMILTRHNIPGDGAFDNAIRRELAVSMIAHGFFRNLGFLPDLDSQKGPIWIGLGQADTPPLFHIGMTVPLAMFAWSSVTVRLYAVRLTTLGLFVLDLWFAYLLVSELTAPGHPLRWMVPAGLALLPALSDIMTAFNDDVGAVFVFSLLLLAVVRLLRRGPTTRRVMAVIGLAMLCMVTKSTVFIAIPLALVAVALALAPPRWLPVAVVVVVAIAGLGLVSTLAWGDAAAWYRVSPQPVPARVETPIGPWGQHAIRLLAQPGQAPAELKQELLASDVKTLAGKQVTMGAWIWAGSPGPAALPTIEGGSSTALQVLVGTMPAFHAATVTLPDSVQSLAVVLTALPQPGESDARGLYYGGIVLVEGAWPAGTAPVLDGPDGQSGTWAGRTFANHIRNASAEQGSLWVRPWAEAVFGRLAGSYLSPSILIGALADSSRTNSIYVSTSNLLLQSFWARFGWSSVALPPAWYQLATAMTALGGVAGAVQLIRVQRAQTLSWKLASGWLALAALVSWGTVFLRGLFTVLGGHVVLPVARYAFPVVIPTMLLLMAGWQALLGNPRDWRAALPFGFFVVLDLVSILTIFRYYY